MATFGISFFFSSFVIFPVTERESKVIVCTTGQAIHQFTYVAIIHYSMCVQHVGYDFVIDGYVFAYVLL